MKRLALVIAATLVAGPAGAVYINGSRAAVKNFSEDAYEARGRDVAISIGVERAGQDHFDTTSADLTQAGGNMTFRPTKRGDLFLIQAGSERYEIPEAAVFGG